MKELTEKNQHSNIQQQQDVKPYETNSQVLTKTISQQDLESDNPEHSSSRQYHQHQKKTQLYQQQSYSQTQHVDIIQSPINSLQLLQTRQVQSGLVISQQQNTSGTQLIQQTNNVQSINQNDKHLQSEGHLLQSPLDLQSKKSINSDSLEEIKDANILDNQQQQEVASSKYEQNNSESVLSLENQQDNSISNIKTCSISFQMKDPLQIFSSRMKSFLILQTYQKTQQTIIKRDDKDFVDFEPQPRKFSYLPYQAFVTDLPEIGQAINVEDIKGQIKKYFSQRNLQQETLNIKLQESQHYIIPENQLQNQQKMQQSKDLRQFKIKFNSGPFQHEESVQFIANQFQKPSVQFSQTVPNLNKHKKNNQSIGNPTIKIFIKKPKETKNKSPFKIINRTQLIHSTINNVHHTSCQQCQKQKINVSPAKMPGISFNTKIAAKNVYPSQNFPHFFQSQGAHCMSKELVEKIQSLQKCNIKYKQCRTPQQKDGNDNFTNANVVKKKKIQLTSAFIHNGNNKVNRNQSGKYILKTEKQTKQENKSKRKIKISQLQSPNLQKKIHHLCNSISKKQEDTIRKHIGYKEHKISDINVFLNTSHNKSYSPSRSRGIFRSHDKIDNKYQFIKQKPKHQKNVSYCLQTKRQSLKTIQRHSFNSSNKKSTVRKGVSHSNLFQQKVQKTNKVNHNRSDINFQSMQYQSGQPYLQIGKVSLTNLKH